MSCEVITDKKQTPIIYVYLLPSTLEHLPELEEALKLFRDQDTIELGYLSTNIIQAQNQGNHQVANMLMEFRLMDLLHHFRQRWRYRHMKTWYWMRHGIVLQAKSVQGTYQRHFKMVVIRGVRNFPLDHLVLRARLLIFPTEAFHHRDVGGLPSQMRTGNRGSKEIRS